MADKIIRINRAPVLTLWASVVAKRQGFDADTALTLGKAVAGLITQTKGRRLGIFAVPTAADGKPAAKSGPGEDCWVSLCGRSIPAKHTKQGLRAVVKDSSIDPDNVRAYLEKSFGDDLTVVREAVQALAGVYTPEQLAESAFALYEKFRPQIAAGVVGWGQKRPLRLDMIRSLARQSRV